VHIQRNPSNAIQQRNPTTVTPWVAQQNRNPDKGKREKEEKKQKISVSFPFFSSPPFPFVCVVELVVIFHFHSIQTNPTSPQTKGTPKHTPPHTHHPTNTHQPTQPTQHVPSRISVQSIMSSGPSAAFNSNRVVASLLSVVGLLRLRPGPRFVLLPRSAEK